MESPIVSIIQLPIEHIFSAYQGTYIIHLIQTRVYSNSSPQYIDHINLKQFQLSEELKSSIVLDYIHYCIFLSVVILTKIKRSSYFSVPEEPRLFPPPLSSMKQYIVSIESYID